MKKRSRHDSNTESKTATHISKGQPMISSFAITINHFFGTNVSHVWSLKKIRISVIVRCFISLFFTTLFINRISETPDCGIYEPLEGDEGEAEPAGSAPPKSSTAGAPPPISRWGGLETEEPPSVSPCSLPADTLL